MNDLAWFAVGIAIWLVPAAPWIGWHLRRNLDSAERNAKWAQCKHGNVLERPCSRCIKDGA